MPDVVAKAMAVITGVLLVGTLALLYVTSRPPAGTREVVAEFQDAFPMLEGMQVRTAGAIAGSIGPIEVNDKGLAELTLLVDSTLPAPRADAVATIKQADTTGDSYVAYDPGTASEELGEVDGMPTIECAAPKPSEPCTNTLAAPRFDDLINAFGPPEQAGVKLILGELATALAERGDDVNRAALDLVPALTEANVALAEINTQNDALKAFISDMEDVSGQAASRREQLANMIESLDETLVVTANRTGPLDAALDVLPETQAQLRSTLVDLSRSSVAVRPFASELSEAAPGLRSLLDKAPEFVKDVRIAIEQGGPTLDLTKELLIASGPTIEADPQRVVTGSFDLAPALSNLLKGILGGDDTIRAFFGDEADGGPETREDFGYGLGAVATDPGNLAGFPAEWEDRRFVRLGAILNCDSFGIPVAPGCLASLLASRRTNRRDQVESRKPAKRPDAAPDDPTAAPVTPVRDVVQDEVDRVKDVVDQTRGVVEDLTKQLGVPVDELPTDDVLDYLLG